MKGKDNTLMITMMLAMGVVILMGLWYLNGSIYL